MRYLVTILAAIALLALALVSGCGLISGLGDDSSSSDSAADISTDASFDDTSFLSNDNNAFLSDTGSATTTEDSNLDPENTLEIQLKDGTVVIELLADVAPLHVARLKELTRQGFYNGIKFHRVIDGFMAQTGDPQGNGTGGSSLPDLPAEFSSVPFERGTVGMARSQNPDSANSQFFIMFAEGSFLNGQYTVFGQVRSGMEFVDNIKKGAGQNGTSFSGEPDTMISVKVAADG
ncbi:MAG: peptidylprolyl isomerase [Geminicoccus sp.]|nr:peptidylprolyl isomerase [Geminicoccus sp.]